MRVIAGFEIATGRIVRFHAAGGDPFQISMRGYWGVGFIEVAINVRVAGEGVRLRAVGEVVDVLRADHVDEFERGLAAAGLGLCPTFSRGLGLSRRGSGC